MERPSASQKRALSTAVKRPKLSASVSSSDEEEKNLLPKKDTLRNGRPSSAQLKKNLGCVTMNSFENYLMWENNANVCWLDASMALLVHNITLMARLKDVNDSKSQVFNIARYYHTAHCELNASSGNRTDEEKATFAKRCLRAVQEQALKYLQPILKYKEGEPDSAFCSLLNLINEIEPVKNIFELEYSWSRVCRECDRKHQAATLKKSIITFGKVHTFQPQTPVALYQCPGCKEPDQKMTLRYRTLPPCLLFHFENGAGSDAGADPLPKSFKVEGRLYRLTGVITLEKSRESYVNHFITFVRKPETEEWLECNDLNDSILQFVKVTPVLVLRDVYILLYEAADDRGTVRCRLKSADRSASESVGGSADIPLIDLADDMENHLSEKTMNKGSGRVGQGSGKTRYLISPEMKDQGSSSENPGTESSLNSAFRYREGLFETSKAKEVLSSQFGGVFTCVKKDFSSLQTLNHSKENTCDASQDKRSSPRKDSFKISEQSPKTANGIKQNANLTSELKNTASVEVDFHNKNIKQNGNLEKELQSTASIETDFHRKNEIELNLSPIKVSNKLNGSPKKSLSQSISNVEKVINTEQITDTLKTSRSKDFFYSENNQVNEDCKVTNFERELTEQMKTNEAQSPPKYKLREVAVALTRCDFPAANEKELVTSPSNSNKNSRLSPRTAKNKQSELPLKQQAAKNLSDGKLEKVNFAKISPDKCENVNVSSTVRDKLKRKDDDCRKISEDTNKLVPKDSSIEYKFRKRIRVVSTSSEDMSDAVPNAEYTTMDISADTSKPVKNTLKNGRNTYKRRVKTLSGSSEDMSDAPVSEVTTKPVSVKTSKTVIKAKRKGTKCSSSSSEKLSRTHEDNLVSVNTINNVKNSRAESNCESLEDVNNLTQHPVAFVGRPVSAHTEVHTKKCVSMNENSIKTKHKENATHRLKTTIPDSVDASYSVEDVNNQSSKRKSKIVTDLDKEKSSKNSQNERLNASAAGTHLSEETASDARKSVLAKLFMSPAENKLFSPEGLDPEMMCPDDCDCGDKSIDETIEIVTNAVLHSILGAFAIKRQ